MLNPSALTNVPRLKGLEPNNSIGLTSFIFIYRTTSWDVQQASVAGQHLTYNHQVCVRPDQVQYDFPILWEYVHLLNERINRKLNIK